jgi:hypothetical protein
VNEEERYPKSSYPIHIDLAKMGKPEELKAVVAEDQQHCRGAKKIKVGRAFGHSLLLLDAGREFPWYINRRFIGEAAYLQVITASCKATRDPLEPGRAVFVSLSIATCKKSCSNR